jgi:hypothetical protein
MSGEPALRQVRVDFEELALAFDNASSEQTYFLDTETGELVLVSDLMDSEEEEELRASMEGDASQRYLQVPLAEPGVGYRDMERFIASLNDKRLQELLEVAIQGRGAFRRFKDVLAGHPAELEQWFAFKAASLETRAREWLAAERCEPVAVTSLGPAEPRQP